MHGVGSFLTEVNTISQEVLQGQWKGKEDIVVDKILFLFRSRAVTNNTQYMQEREFTTDVTVLIDALKGMENQTNKVKTAVQKLGLILQKGIEPEKSGALGSMRDLKTLPSDKPNLRDSLDTLKKLIREETSKSKEALANWIDYNQVSLSKLELSKEELNDLAPHLRYFSIDKNSLTETDIHEFLSKCSNLKNLKLETDNITTISTLPSGLEKFNCSMCPNLTEVTRFNDTLSEFESIGCESLLRLPEKTPPSLTNLEYEGCPLLERHPVLNEGLQYLNISGTMIPELPILPSSLEVLLMHDCPNTLDLPEKLPENLKILDIQKSGVQKLPDELPELERLVISWCVNLKVEENFEAQLPKGMELIR